MLRLIFGFAAGFVTAKLFSSSACGEKFKNVAAKCKTAVKDEFKAKEEASSSK